MKISATVVNRQYFDIEIEVPDDATEREQQDAIIAAVDWMSPDDHDTEVTDLVTAHGEFSAAQLERR